MTGSVCAVISCKNRNRNLKKGDLPLKYFRFPKDKVLSDEWLLRCRSNCRKGYKSKFKVKNLRVCSRHFHIDDFEDALSSKLLNIVPKKLKSQAIPTLFLKYELHENGVDSNAVQNSPIRENTNLAVKKDMLNDENDIHSKSKKKTDSQAIERISTEDQSNDSYESNRPMPRTEQKHRPVPGFDFLENQDFSDIVIKEEEIIKPYVDDSYAASTACIGQCFVCDKNLQQRDIESYPRDNFTRIVKKLLGDISSECMLVVGEEDGLCSLCRSLVARICRLEVELQTANLGLRALLRLKYSLPFPSTVQERNNPDKELKPTRTTENYRNTTEDRELRTNSLNLNKCKASMSEEYNVLHAQLGLHKLNKKDCMTQTAAVDIYRQRHKIIQTGYTHFQKHQKTQTMESVFHDAMKIVPCIVLKLQTLETKEFVKSNNKEPEDKSSEIILTANEGNSCLVEDVHNTTELSEIPKESCLSKENLGTENKLEVDCHKKTTQSSYMQSGKLKCGRCKFKTVSAEKMNSHVSSFINREGFYCDICDFAYHLSGRFKRHKMCHSKTSKNKRCIFCNQKIHDNLHMKFHIEACHKKDSFSHQCLVCNRVFMFKPLLRRHHFRRHKEKPILRCEKCNITFFDKIKLDNHLDIFHRDSLACKYCSTIYPTLGSLIGHERREHRFEAKQCYQCKYCSKKFIRPERLPLHEEQHTGRFEFRCGICGFGFHEEELLEKHQVHCKTAKKPPQSPKEFLRAPRNRTAPSTWGYGHLSMICDVCGKIIRTRQKYNIHRELHDNPSSFQCEYCGKKFRYKCNMKIHIKNLHLSNCNDNDG